MLDKGFELVNVGGTTESDLSELPLRTPSKFNDESRDSRFSEVVSSIGTEVAASEVPGSELDRELPEQPLNSIAKSNTPMLKEAFLDTVSDGIKRSLVESPKSLFRL